jgi:hypothetical protein
MDSPELHGDALLVRHLLARLAPSERESVLSLQPEFQQLQKARDAAERWLREPTDWSEDGVW